jgi:2-succinyl-5-enolpyruvyl-6-hydroxy-3-cyclohexene-1-carboxylate synthase
LSNVAPETAASFSATLVDEWARSGLREAVVCPGSRSTPLAMALLANKAFRVSVRLDERGAGFFAIGLALASRRPTVVLTTSGTAAAELHAAVIEAHHARVPLIVCTADRPPELRDAGAPQTIDQAHLFVRAVRWFADPGVPDETARWTWRSLASRAVAEATAGPFGPGPVHLNLPFREPLLGDAGELPPPRPGGAPWHDVRPRPDAPVAELAERLRGSARGVVVAGARPGIEPVELVLLAGELGWPILADPRSGCRLKETHVVAAADALLRDEAFAAAMTPEVVLRLGDPWASKVLASWLSRTAADGAVHLAVDAEGAWKDPGRDAAGTVEALVPCPTGHSFEPSPHPAGDWLDRWAEAEAAAQSAIDDVLADQHELTEPGVARALYAHVPGDGSIVASSSMPVRELEWFGRPRSAPPRVLANRGANGIDGVLSTLLGVAASGPGGPAFGLLGDLAVLHDVSALVRSSYGSPPMPAVVVVVDNDGGGIFNFLAQATELETAEFELLFGTPQLPHVADVVAGFGYPVRDVSDAGDLLGALGAATAEAAATQLPSFVVVRTDRRANVALHGEIDLAVRKALGGLRAGS